MPGQGRVGDLAKIQVCSHGCPGCPHPATGPAIIGSPDVNTNSLPSLRVDDIGIHAVCCAANMWKAASGSSSVFINNKAAFRKGDPTKHCETNMGELNQASTNVIVGG